MNLTFPLHNKYKLADLQLSSGFQDSAFTGSTRQVLIAGFDSLASVGNLHLNGCIFDCVDLEACFLHSFMGQ